MLSRLSIWQCVGDTLGELAGRKLTEDTCYAKSKLEYCDKTYALQPKCKYNTLAWGIFIGVPAAVVILAIIIIVVVMKKRYTCKFYYITLSFLFIYFRSSNSG